MAFVIGGGITIGGGISFVDGPPPADPYWDNVVTLLSSLTTTPPADNNTFVDSSTNNFTVTRNGAPGQGSFNPYGQNWSSYFDGAADYLVAASSTAFAFGTGNYTIEAWVFPTQQTLQQILNFSDDRDNLDLNANGTINFFDGTGYTSTATYTVNAWNHIAYVRNSGTVTVYLNGTSIISTASNYNSASARSFTMGARGVAVIGNNALRGYMSNIRVVKGSALYTTNFTPSTTPLQPVSNTSLLTCNSTRTIDNSPNNLTITRTGSVTTESFGPYGGVTLPTQNYGAYFDGNGDFVTTPSSASVAPTGDFTIECWFYANTLTSTNSGLVGLAFIGNSGLNDGRLQMGINPDGSTYFYMRNNSAVDVVTVTSAIGLVTTGTWYHYAVTRSGNTYTAYLNGTSVATATSATAMTYAANILNIGFNRTSNLLQYWNGVISNFRLVTGSVVYTGNFTPSTTPLTAVANTSLLTCQTRTFVDNSTNNFSLTVSGNARPSTLNPFATAYSTQQTYSAAVTGGSAYFNDAENAGYLTVPDSAVFAFGSGNFTIEAWFYATATTNTTNAIVAKSAAGIFGPWILYYTNTNTVTFFSSSNGTSWDIANAVSLGSAALNQWHHVAVSRQGSSIRLFLNGTLVNTITSAASLTVNSLPVAIGGRSSASELFTGYISNVRITNTFLYTSNFALPVGPLTAVSGTALLMNTANAGIDDFATVTDYGTVGNTALSTAVTKFGNSSIAFDGSGDYMVAPSDDTFDFATGDFTVETWVYFNILTTNRMIVDRWATGNTGGWQLYWRQTGTSLTFYVGAAVVIQDASTTRITTGTWYHVAVTRASGTVRMFVDGVQVGSATNNASLSSTLPLALGIQYSTLTNDLAGYLSDFRITKGFARYTANFTPPTAALPTY